MSDLVKSTTTILTVRTPALIAAEINEIKGQTRKMVMYNSIEIGRRLVEAKSLLDHGEWGNWLKNSVNYSQRTAENLMRIFNEYGADQITLLTDNTKSQAFANLSYSQAVLLLGVPEEEREAFVSNNDIENMSTRELKQAIKERDQAKAEAEKAVEEKETALHELDKIKAQMQTAENKVSSLEAEKDKLIKQLESANSKTNEDIKNKQAELEKSKSELEKVKTKLKELETKSLEVKSGATPEDIEKIKSETASAYEKEMALIKIEKEQAEKRVKELEIKVTQQNNAAALKYKIYFEAITKDFSEILKALSDIKDTDIETYERYRTATGTLISKMSERL